MGSGEAFEIKVYRALSKALSEHRLGLDPGSARVFKHRSYYSRDRQKELYVDVAIELYLPVGGDPVIIWVWECKDYSHTVPVNDVEEFHSKLEQIGADKTKGTVIATGAFQQSAVIYAKSKGIGLARLLRGRTTIEHQAQYADPGGGQEPIAVTVDRPIKDDYLVDSACAGLPSEESYEEGRHGYFSTADSVGGFPLEFRTLREHVGYGLSGLRHELWKLQNAPYLGPCNHVRAPGTTICWDCYFEKQGKAR